MRALRSADRDGGQSSLMLIPAVAGLLFVVLLLVSMLGDGVQKRTGTRTAADAASLAAAEAWRANVDDVYRDAVDHPGLALGLVRQLLDGDVLALDGGRARAAAERFAQGNGADLIAFDARVTSHGLEYYARTRSREAVEKTDTRPEAEAVARVEVSGGLCFADGHLGLVRDGACATGDDALPTPTPTPTSTATAPVSPSPTAPVPSPTSTGPDLVPLRWKVRLVQ